MTPATPVLPAVPSAAPPAVLRAALYAVCWSASVKEHAAQRGDGTLRNRCGAVDGLANLAHTNYAGIPSANPPLLYRSAAKDVGKDTKW